MADVDIKGLEQLLFSLESVTEDIRKAIWDHIKSSAKNVQQTAKSLAHEESGRLKRSIKVEYDEDNLEAVIRAAIFYAHIEEFGAVGHTAQPYMTPALEKEKNDYVKGLSDIVK